MHIPDINTPERFNEFKQALNRALNTWDDGPRWLFDLSDKLEAVQTLTVSLNEQPKAKPSADSESLDTFDVQSLITVAENRARVAKAEHRAAQFRGEVRPVVARTDNHVLVDVLQLKTIRNDITLAGNRLTMAQKILTDLIGDGA